MPNNDPILTDLLSSFPVVIEIPVAWGEMDAFQHVNNIVYFRYFESSRIAYFERIDYMNVMNKTGTGPILASTQCKFKFPLTHPDKLSVGAKVAELEDDRFLMRYRIVSQRHSRIAAEGDGLIVSYNYKKNQRASIQEEVKQSIADLEGSNLIVKKQ